MDNYGLHGEAVLSERGLDLPGVGARLRVDLCQPCADGFNEWMKNGRLSPRG